MDFFQGAPPDAGDGGVVVLFLRRAEVGEAGEQDVPGAELLEAAEGGVGEVGDELDFAPVDPAVDEFVDQASENFSGGSVCRTSGPTV